MERQCGKELLSPIAHVGSFIVLSHLTVGKDLCLPLMGRSRIVLSFGTSPKPSLATGMSLCPPYPGQRWGGEDGWFMLGSDSCLIKSGEEYLPWQSWENKYMAFCPLSLSSLRYSQVLKRPCEYIEVLPQNNSNSCPKSSLCDNKLAHLHIYA